MAFEAFVPNTSAALSGSDAIQEGLTYRRTFTVKKAVSGVDTPVNMTEYDAAAPVIVFKDKDTHSGGVTTGCPTGVCTWTSSSAGEFQLDITQANTNPASQVFSGVYEISVLHDTEEDTAGVKKKALIFKSTWTVEKTATAS